MRREVADFLGSGLLLAALVCATLAVVSEQATAAGAISTVAASSAGADVERGRSLFYLKGCVACHMKQGEDTRSRVGPDLTNLASRAGERRAGLDTAGYVRESLRTPSAFVVSGYSSVGMPELGLRDDEIDALVAYLLGTP